jgi:DNA-binding transcriptional regulator YbjK
MSEMTVGCIRTTVIPQQSGIYEALLEKAERDAAELADRLSGLELSTTQKLAQLEQERNEAIQERERWKMQAEQKWGMRRELEELLGVGDTESEEQFAKGVAALRDLIQERDEAREESLEQARLLGKGGEREARLATERDHYKQALEEIATTIQEYKDSIVQEPSEDFIWAIKAWADKKLREI